MVLPLPDQPAIEKIFMGSYFIIEAMISQSHAIRPRAGFIQRFGALERFRFRCRN